MLETWTTGKSGQVSGKGAKDIDAYNAMHDDSKTGVDGRNKGYVDLVNSYYNLATDFYEWGWGQSFHFAEKLPGESFGASIARHEYYLPMRLGVQPDDEVLDCGCGIGGPLRNIGQFTDARITGVTLNQYQVDRGNQLCRQAALDHKCKLVQADFHKLPFEDNTFDHCYSIEACCHSPDKADVYREVRRAHTRARTLARGHARSMHAGRTSAHARSMHLAARLYGRRCGVRKAEGALFVGASAPMAPEC
jgi:sterol 24-C-methyltransferase